jgi:hypothetical protein
MSIMKTSATTRVSVLSFVLILLAGLFSAAPSVAQSAMTELGDDFIFFFDGPNVLIPEATAQVVADPLNPTSGNRVHKYSYGNWSENGYRFSRTDGIDMTANVGMSGGEGDTLYLKLLVDPANAGQGGVSLTFFDKTDDSPSNDGSADLMHRLQWPIPEALRDGQWHDLAIPLPPMTTAGLDAAKAGNDINGNPLATPLDENAANWVYGGAWSVGSFGVWAPGDCNGAACFQEFQWDGVYSLTVFFDNNSGGGPIYLDDVYIGGPGTDVSAATAAPSAMGGVTFAANGAKNTISWTHDEAFGGYNVYASEHPITSAEILDGSAKVIKSVAFNATAFEADHSVELAHPSLGGSPVYYAVTSKSFFGVENPDVSASSGSISNTDLPVSPYIYVLTEDEANTIFNNVAGYILSDDGFPDNPPFVIDPSHWSGGDSPAPAEASDLSATVKVAVDEFGFLYAYGEVTDDVAGFPGVNADGGGTWNFDSFEIFLGNYDVRDVTGGGLLNGSPHGAYGRGAEADFQIRMAVEADEAGQILGIGIWSHADPGGATGSTASGPVQGAGGVAGPLMDGSGATVGYKFLVAIPLESILDPTADQPFSIPSADELKVMPFNMGMNDKDAGGGREHQVHWSLRAGPSAWSNPSAWQTAAVVGRGLATDVEDGADALPYEFALDQNYPNPFNPSTNIEFSLRSASNVRLEVFNVLGQRVATLVNGSTLPAGAHSVTFDASELTSGMYIYRLQAGSNFSQTRTMMLLK